MKFVAAPTISEQVLLQELNHRIGNFRLLAQAPPNSRTAFSHIRSWWLRLSGVTSP